MIGPEGDRSLQATPCQRHRGAHADAMEAQDQLLRDLLALRRQHVARSEREQRELEWADPPVGAELVVPVLQAHVLVQQ